MSVFRSQEQPGASQDTITRKNKKKLVKMVLEKRMTAL
jgi:hypothetical protein